MAYTGVIVEIVNGSFSLEGTDYSDAVTKVVIAGDADEVEVPATLANPKSSRKGGVKYSITLTVLASAETDQLERKFWDALDADGELDWEATITETGEVFAGTLVVLNAAFGGDAEGLSSTDHTFPLTGRPSESVS